MASRAVLMMDLKVYSSDHQPSNFMVNLKVEKISASDSTYEEILEKILPFDVFDYDF